MAVPMDVTAHSGNVCVEGPVHSWSIETLSCRGTMSCRMDIRTSSTSRAAGMAGLETDSPWRNS